MTNFLSDKKEKWAEARKPKYLRGTPLNPNISDAVRYNKRLNKLIERMTTEVQKELKSLFKSETAQEFFAQDASISSQARILTNALTKKFTKLFDNLAKPISEKVVDEADISSTIAVKFSLKELSGGITLNISSRSPYITDILNVTVTENVALIKSIPQQYLSGVQSAVMRSISTGNGLQDLIPYLESHKQITKRRARFIAYDQTRKAFNNIALGKMVKLGMKEGEWLHTGGSNHPRRLHQQLSGKIFLLDDPPIIEDNGKGKVIKGFPGQLPGCACRYLPVIRFNEN